MPANSVDPDQMPANSVYPDKVPANNVDPDQAPHSVALNGSIVFAIWINQNAEILRTSWLFCIWKTFVDVIMKRCFCVNMLLFVKHWTCTKLTFKSKDLNPSLYIYKSLTSNI